VFSVRFPVATLLPESAVLICTPFLVNEADVAFVQLHEIVVPVLNGTVVEAALIVARKILTVICAFPLSPVVEFVHVASYVLAPYNVPVETVPDVPPFVTRFTPSVMFLTVQLVAFIEFHLKVVLVPYFIGEVSAVRVAETPCTVYESPTAVVFPAVTLNDEAGEYTGPV
jgi:hypothetical protein